jgi:hypothetical protein
MIEIITLIEKLHKRFNIIVRVVSAEQKIITLGK